MLFKVALKVLVDNFSILAVERCLLMDLASILSPDVVMKLDENVVEAIATEPESFGVERQRATDKLRTMREGLMTLNQFNSLKTRRGGTSSPTCKVKTQLMIRRRDGRPRCSTCQKQDPK